MYKGYVWLFMINWCFMNVVGKSQSWGVEDKEIKALEVKLGLGSSSSAKSESALKKLQRCGNT